MEDLMTDEEIKRLENYLKTEKLKLKYAKLLKLQVGLGLSCARYLPNGDVQYYDYTDKYNRLKKLAYEMVSQEHPLACVCGKLCTGLHESSCRRFKEAVENRIIRLAKNEGKL